MSGLYGMQHLKNQYCSNCKRKKLEDRVLVRKSDPMNYLSAEEDLFALLTDCETLIAKAPVKIDIDKAWGEMMKYAEFNDDPPSEPMDTSGSDAYIRSFFNEE
jgi:hypothetical protein